MNLELERHNRTRMELSDEQVRELVAEGDEEQIVRAVSTLRDRVRKKSTLLRHMADIGAELRHAFVETERDRDRLQRMATELHALCGSRDLRREASEIVERYGGICGAGEKNFIG